MVLFHSLAFPLSLLRTVHDHSPDLLGFDLSLGFLDKVFHRDFAEFVILQVSLNLRVFGGVLLGEGSQ